MARGRRPSTTWAASVVILGLVVMAQAALAAGRYVPGWFDPSDGPPCTFSPDGCGAGPEAELSALWVRVVVGAVVVVLGLGLSMAAASGERGVRNAPGWSPAVHAAVAGGVAALVAPGVVVVALLLLALLVERHGIAVVLTASWLAQALALAHLDRSVGHPDASERRSWSAALVVSAAATAGALAAVGTEVADDLGPVALLDGALVGLGVLAARWLLDPPRSRRRVRASGALVAVLVGLLVAVQSGRALQDDPAAVPPPGRGVPEPAPDRVPTAPTTRPPAPATPTPTTPAVVAGVPCAANDLGWSVRGFDAALGARGAGLVVTNETDRPCWVEGVPSVTLLQGGRPLDLTVEPAVAGPAEVARLGLAPGDRAVALLTWRTYAGWSDPSTPQSVTAALGPGAEPVAVPVASPYGPAPFDIADGGAWGIGPWAPPSS